jgi:hypothetical protein
MKYFKVSVCGWKVPGFLCEYSGIKGCEHVTVGMAYSDGSPVAGTLPLEVSDSLDDILPATGNLLKVHHTVTNVILSKVARLIPEQTFIRVAHPVR